MPLTERRPVVCILDGSADVSGAFVAARREAALLGDKADFVLLMSDKSRIADDQLTEFARVYRLPIGSLHRSIRSALFYPSELLLCSLRIRGLLSREQCSRLQLNDFHYAHGAVLRLLGYRGRIVTWVRLDPRKPGKIGSLWLNLARRSSERLVAVSDYIRRLATSSKTMVIYDPVPVLPVIGDRDGDPNLVFLGSYQRNKGQDCAIRAFQKIVGKHPQARLIFFGSDIGIAGSIAYLARLRDLAKRGPGSDQIEFRTFVKDPVDALKIARAALCLSRTESFGLVCQEASACGIPVIATRCGGPEEIIEDGVTGYLVDIDDIDAIADRMDRLLSDPVVARSLGMAGVKLVRERFPPEPFKAAIRELFDL